MSLKLNFNNSHALERTFAELNFEIRVPFLTTNQTWDKLTNSDHIVWALFTLKFYLPSKTYHIKIRRYMHRT